MKILFTGASSFTGFWFVKTLTTAGHEVVCPLTGDVAHYTGLRQQRMELLKPLCRTVEHAAFGTENFLKLAGSQKYDLLCHHAADVTNYKSPDFDAVKALENNTFNLRAVLKSINCPVLLTGTMFEHDEGKGDEPLRAFSPYGLSKGATYQFFRHYCREAQVPLGKFVIPNPFGPHEEPRGFTAYVLKQWKEGKVPQVKTPLYVRDNVPVDLLSLEYSSFAGRLWDTKSDIIKCSPSGYVETQKKFALRVSREVSDRLGWACGLEFLEQTDFSEPLKRTNLEPVLAKHPAWNEPGAWDGFVEFYRGIL